MLDHNLVLDDAARERLLDRFGPEARQWCDELAHAADLLAADLKAGALLLERIEPGTKLSEFAALPPINAFAALLGGLRESRVGDAARLRSSEEGVEFIFGLIARRAADPHVSDFVPGRW